MTAQSWPLPSGARLIHIGPHKTGTTSLQHAMHGARTEMREQGVRYLSRSRHDAGAARWVTDTVHPGDDPAGAERSWLRIVSGMGADHDDRRVFSSESLANATDEQIDRVFEDLGTENTFVAVTLRPLAEILPSQYQQFLVGRALRTYEQWLTGVMADRGPDDSRIFWRRHRHDELVRRWGERVGQDNVVVVVLDRTDFDFIPSSFERILGLSENTLVGQPTVSNRSLTSVEVELLRQFNEHYQRADRRREDYPRLVRQAVRHLKERVPPADEAKLATPAWAVDEANAIGAAMAENIAASGARVLGDLGSLSQGRSGDASDPPVQVPVDLAAHFAVGLAPRGQTKSDPAS